MSFEFWFMLPISILIATIAMASGVEGATFFTPLFLLTLGLPPKVAIGVGLATEVFGFASGLFVYIRKRLIDYRLSGALLVVTVPTALLGTYLSGIVPPNALKAVLGIGLFAIAISFFRSPDHEEVKAINADIARGNHQDKSCLETAAGEEICYEVCNRSEGRLISGLGALFIGMVSTGLGEMNGFFLLQRCRVPSRVAVATSVLVVAVTALDASIGHAVIFVREGGDYMGAALSLLIFTVPGVIIGGQLGPMVASRISAKLLERSMGFLFVFVGMLMLTDVLMQQF